MNLLEILETAKNPPKVAEPVAPEQSGFLRMQGLDNIECGICGNTGTIAYIGPNGMTMFTDCSCMRRRKNKRNIKLAGLENLCDRYTFLTYNTDNDETAALKETALEYARNPQGQWFFISGRPGSGKTHICTAICNRLMEKGFLLTYMSWRDEAVRIKSMITDAEEYSRDVSKLKSVHVLYIDDFLKGSVTDADLNLAFQIINGRYTNENLITIISSERPLSEIIATDEATGSRIKQRAVCVTAPNNNRRLNNNG